MALEICDRTFGLVAPVDCSKVRGGSFRLATLLAFPDSRSFGIEMVGSFQFDFLDLRLYRSGGWRLVFFLV
ncbi:hypothetical protein LINPERPRIM_LOCUS19166 [Linum perenne]